MNGDLAKFNHLVELRHLPSTREVRHRSHQLQAFHDINCSLLLGLLGFGHLRSASPQQGDEQQKDLQIVSKRSASSQEAEQCSPNAAGPIE